MTYRSLITKVGQAKIQNAINNNTKVNIVKMVLGDGNGEEIEPSENQTSLINKVSEVSANYAVTEDGYFVIRAVVPKEVGGFTIREKGLVDEDGDLIVVGNYPSTYKPTIEEGDAKEIVMSFYIAITNADAIQITPLESDIYATKNEVANVRDEAYENYLSNVAAIELLGKGLNSGGIDGVINLDSFSYSLTKTNTIKMPNQKIMIDGVVYELSARDLEIPLNLTDLFKVEKVWATKEGYVVSPTQPPQSVPICEVTMLNPFAYDPEFNPLGTAKYADDKYWYETGESRGSEQDTKDNALADSIGRPDNFRSDRIYSFMVRDTRKSILRPDRANLLWEYHLKAVNASQEIEARYPLRKLKHLSISLSSDATTDKADGGIYLFRDGKRWYVEALEDETPKKEQCVLGLGRSLSARRFFIDFMDSDDKLLSQELITEVGYGDQIQNGDRPDGTVGGRLRIYEETDFFLNGYSPMLDIIGNAAVFNNAEPYNEFYCNYREVNDDGSSAFPDGNKTTWKLTHKMSDVEKAIHKILVTTDGKNFKDAGGWSVDATANKIILDNAPENGSAIFVFYQGYARQGREKHWTENLKTELFLPFGWVGNAGFSNLGSVLISSLTNKVGDMPTTGEHNGLQYQFAITAFSSHNELRNFRVAVEGEDVWSKRISHFPLSLAGSDWAITVKSAIVLLSSENGELFLGYIFNEGIDGEEIVNLQRGTADTTTGKIKATRLIPLPYHDV
jgi:hypothetical protein